MSISLQFPDETYTTDNKPQVEVIKSDFSAIENAVNTLETTSVTLTGSNTLINKTLTSPVINTGISGTAILDEDNMASDSATKLATQQSIKAYVDTAITTAKSALFPIGSIYTAIVATNPGTLLGFGTWTAFGAGKVLVGLDAGQTEFDTVEETGGAKTHTLTTDEMPAHTHTVAEDNNPGSTLVDPANLQVGVAGSPLGSAATSSTGGGGAHNNLQPYIVVYFWKRTV